MKGKENILLETGTNEVEIAEFDIYNKDDNTKLSFGINVAKVREIMRMPKFTALPGISDNNVLGVFELRHKIIPLIDLAAWMNEKTDIDYSRCYVIVTEFNQANFGFVIHGVNRIYRLSWEKILSPTNISENSNSIKANCITGIINFDDRILMMLDFEKIVADINPEMSLRIESDKKIIDDIQHIGNRKQKVLLAEDSGIVRDLLSDILERGGFEIVNANNGKVALEYLDAFLDEAKKYNNKINDIIQLVITDIEMPQMDGHSLCRKIKENDDLKTLPVVLFSSLIYDEIKKKGELIGADAQISKPEIGSLLNIIRDILKKKQEELKVS